MTHPDEGLNGAQPNGWINGQAVKERVLTGIMQQLLKCW